MAADLVISHYRILHAIGEGGMGEVYLGLDETLRRRVALKAIRPERRLDPSTKARFLREARTLSQLDHAHICRVYDYIETPDRDWIVLELVEGRTLSEAIRDGLRGVERLTIAQQIAAVLVATHAAGVVHRDLKPGNVMLTRAGDVKVLDFGLSAIVSSAKASSAAAAPPFAVSDAQSALDDTRLPPDDGADDAAAMARLSQFQSQVGSITGTIAYMSPEQARGEAATAASDMYSYGLVLQELFTGRRPYGETAGAVELLRKAQRGESLGAVGVPPHLGALLIRLKSLAPTQRPTAVDTLERLKWIARRPHRVRRNLLFAGLLLAAVLGSAKYTIDVSRARNAALRARDEADQRRGQAEGLIGFMVGDLRNKLSAVGRLEILDDVGQQALAYFASVPADTLTDEERYRRSQALHQLGQVRQARGDLAGALKTFEESLAQAEEVARRRPDNAEWQLGLGASHFYVGDLQRRRGNLDAALAHFNAYKSIAERLVKKDPSKFEWRLELSYGHSNAAAIYSSTNNLAAARDELQVAGALQAELATQKPGDATLQASRANNYSRLGIVEDGLGKLAEAVDSFGHELEIYRQLLSTDSMNTRIRRRMQISLIYRGRALRVLGHPDEAATDLRRAVDEARALVALDPTNADWQRDLASGGLALAYLEYENGDLGGALDRFARSLEIFGGLFKKNPTRAVEQRDLAKAHLGMAEALSAKRIFRDGGIEVDAALAILQPLADKNPSEAEVAVELARAENVRGAIWAALGQPLRASRAWSHAVAVLEPTAERSHDYSVVDPWVRSLMFLGRVDAARRGYDTLISIGYRDRGFLTFWAQHSANATISVARQP